MSRDGNGTYTAPVNSWNPAINGVLATAGDYQALLNDIVAALTQSVSRDGQSPMTGPLNMGNNKISGVTAGTGTGEALAFQQLFAQGTQADLASASTTDIGLQNTTFLRITGNTTITSFGSNYRGPRFLVFEGALTLTNSSTLVLPGNANITTAAGDVLIAIPGATLGTADKWIVTSYQKANTAPGYANMPGGFGFRNRIINGDMRIDQRNAGASVGTASGIFTYTLDRWMVIYSQLNKFTVQQNAGSITPPSGYTNYLGVTSSSAYTVGASELFVLQQRIEGFNTADLAFGSSSASSITLSFWVRSSLTGTFGGSLKNNAENRSYPFSYTISSANTWEYKTITILGDTAGTWLTNNSVGFLLTLSLGAGSTGSGTAGAWAGSNLNSVTGATSVVGTSGATFYITGVQLEAGTVASPFERRDYGRELMMCQRYYEEIVYVKAGGQSYSGQLLDFIVFYSEKRAIPTLSYKSQTFSGAMNGNPSLNNVTNKTAHFVQSAFNALNTNGSASGIVVASSEL